MTKKIERVTCRGAECLLVNDRYLIYMDNWVVYDTIKGQDIPQYVFEIRDREMKRNIKRIMFNGIECLLVNDRYQIYLNNGVIYDTIKAQDIPQYVFKIRDREMNKREV